MTPPEGSNITIESEGGHERIVARHGSGGVLRFLIGAFVIAWLGGWAFGWIAAFSSLIRGEETDSAFLIFWLIAWTVGGVFAFWMAYILLRPSVPEQFTLQLPTLRHDSGRPPFTISFDYQSQMDAWRKIFRRRVITNFSQEEMQTLRIREFVSGNRVTVDKGARRHELGTGLTEIEREWLYRILAQRYNVEQIGGADRSQRVSFCGHTIRNDDTV